MYNQCSVAVFKSFEDASQAIQALDTAHYPEQQVSVVTHDVAKQVPQEQSLQYGDKSVQDVATGAGTGGLLGLLLTSPLLAIPGVGPAIFVGPLAAGATGAIVGGFLGGMTGWGVHEDHVQDYERRVREGCLLVVANGDPAEVAKAHRIFQESAAVETHMHARTSADAAEIDDRPRE